MPTQTNELTITQAAEQAKVTRQAIHKAILAGHIRARLTTLGWLIDARSFDVWRKDRGHPLSE